MMGFVGAFIERLLSRVDLGENEQAASGFVVVIGTQAPPEAEAS